MRWDRLFAELEAQLHDDELQERDALVDELRDGEWAATSWRATLGGHVVLEIGEGTRVEGALVLANDHVVQLAGGRVDHVVDVSAVTGVVSTGRRVEPPSRVARARGWSQVLRALRDAGDGVRVTRRGSTPVDGVVEVVGRDFVRLRLDSGQDVGVPFAAIAVVSGRT